MNNNLSTQLILTDLSKPYGLLAVTGDDAASFLQNQFSNDVKAVSEQQSQLNSYCTPKGRILSVFRLFKIGDSYYLRMPITLIESIQKRLQMYVLRSKVQLTNASTSFARFGLAGPGASAQLEAITNSVPSEINIMVSNAEQHITRLPGNERFEVYTSTEQAELLWSQLKSHAQTKTNDCWPLLDILAGIPTIYPETSEHFVPQMTNLQLINGVSFKKGCYPGQEIVARMQYRGTLKRRMHLVQLPGTPPAPGSNIISISGGKPHEAGEIVDARQASDSNSLGLAVLQVSRLEHPLHIENENGPKLGLLELPYGYDAK